MSILNMEFLLYFVKNIKEQAVWISEKMSEKI